MSAKQPLDPFHCSIAILIALIAWAITGSGWMCFLLLAALLGGAYWSGSIWHRG
jgi:hypothetical protein